MLEAKTFVNNMYACSVKEGLIYLGQEQDLAIFVRLENSQEPKVRVPIMKG